ncbi:MAG: TIGR04255 family protein [Sandaracinaceae bacterium]
MRQSPLVLVLCQVRFSRVRKMRDYIPGIQDAFRRRGFPTERAGKRQQLLITPAGVQSVEEDRWEYRTRDERWSITVVEDSVVLQTTAYERFEDFAEKLEAAVRTVLEETEQTELGLVERVGLRYVDLVQPREGESYRDYLRPGFHGAPAPFVEGSHRLFVQSVGRTDLGDDSGTMVLRVFQNDQGADLPPDLLVGAPEHLPRAKAGELVTLVDMDHYVEGKFDPSPEWVIARAYAMHDHLIEAFHEHVVSPHAIEVWR